MHQWTLLIYLLSLLLGYCLIRSFRLGLLVLVAYNSFIWYAGSHQYIVGRDLIIPSLVAMLIGAIAAVIHQSTRAAQMPRRRRVPR